MYVVSLVDKLSIFCILNIEMHAKLNIVCYKEIIFVNKIIIRRIISKKSTWFHFNTTRVNLHIDKNIRIIFLNIRLV